MVTSLRGKCVSVLLVGVAVGSVACGQTGTLPSESVSKLLRVIAHTPAYRNRAPKITLRRISEPQSPAISRSMAVTKVNHGPGCSDGIESVIAEAAVTAKNMFTAYNLATGEPTFPGPYWVVFYVPHTETRPVTAGMYPTRHPFSNWYAGFVSMSSPRAKAFCVSGHSSSLPAITSQ